MIKYSNSIFLCSQIILGLLFSSFIIFPHHIPHSVLMFLNSSLGIVSIFAISVSLFCYVNPVLALLFLFVSYLSICQINVATPNEHIIQYTPTMTTQHIDDSHMVHSKVTTLEEQVVDRMAPLGNREPTSFIESSFKPLFNKTNSASLF